MENLKKLRKESKLTQLEFSKKFNLSLRGYQDIENDINQTSYENLIKFADFFHCSVDYLLGHQAKNVLYLDSYTPTQKRIIEAVKDLSEDESYQLLGYIARMKDVPLEVVLLKKRADEEE